MSSENIKEQIQQESENKKKIVQVMRERVSGSKMKNME